jgi:hypothetical protein
MSPQRGGSNLSQLISVINSVLIFLFQARGPHPVTVGRKNKKVEKKEFEKEEALYQYFKIINPECHFLDCFSVPFF